MQALGATDHGHTTPAAQRASAGAAIHVSGPINLPGFVMSFSRNEEIFGEEEPADFAYKVISGAVRTVRVMSDGRRQIGAFHLPGDVFGLELGDFHRFSAEAVVECQIALIRRSHVDKAANGEPGVARALWAMAAHDLERLHDHMLLLARKSAAERVGSFLIEMAERIGEDDAINLPMSRTDIADYLGLTIETVSRTFTQLEREGAIGLAGCRRVLLKHPTALREALP